MPRLEGVTRLFWTAINISSSDSYFNNANPVSAGPNPRAGVPPSHLRSARRYSVVPDNPQPHASAPTAVRATIRLQPTPSARPGPAQMPAHRLRVTYYLAPLHAEARCPPR